MLHVEYEGFQAWHLLYVAYLLWVTGLSVFILIATAREPMELVGQMSRSCLGILANIWVTSALTAFSLAWPLIIGGPFLVVKMGAPVDAGIIMVGYLIMSSLLSGKLLMVRWPAVFSQYR